MQAIVSDVARSVCASVCWSQPWALLKGLTEPIHMPFYARTRMGQKNHVLDAGPNPPRERTTFFGGGAASPIGTNQSYSGGGSSDVAVRCQYCSNLKVWRQCRQHC